MKNKHIFSKILLSSSIIFNYSIASANGFYGDLTPKSNNNVDMEAKYEEFISKSKAQWSNIESSVTAEKIKEVGEKTVDYAIEKADCLADASTLASKQNCILKN